MDIRALHITVEDVKCRTQKEAKPLLSAKFVFDDHIRCMAAKQRLSKVTLFDILQKIKL